MDKENWKKILLEEVKKIGLEFDGIPDYKQMEFVIKSLILATEKAGQKSDIRDIYMFDIAESVVKHTKGSDCEQLKRLVDMEKLEIDIHNKRIEVLQQLIKNRQ